MKVSEILISALCVLVIVFITAIFHNIVFYKDVHLSGVAITDVYQASERMGIVVSKVNVKLDDGTYASASVGFQGFPKEGDIVCVKYTQGFVFADKYDYILQPIELCS